MALDTQAEHIGGLIQVVMNAAAANSCRSVVLYAPPHGQAANQFPALWVYRASERMARWGSDASLGREASFRVLYVPGVMARAKLEDAAGLLSWGVQMISDAVLTTSHPSYQGGQKLETLAAIEQIDIGDITYNLDQEMPQVEVTLVVRHRWLRTPGASVLVTKFIGDLNLDADASKPIRRDEYPPA